MESKNFNENKQEISPFYRVKIAVCGINGVGKSSIVNLLEEEEHDPYITSTIGIGFATQDIELENFRIEGEIPKYYWVETQKDKKSKPINTMIKTQIWDVAGQVRFFSIVKQYLRDVDVAFMVYDIYDRYSWLDLEKWKIEIDKYKKYDRVPLFVLVGNKSDKVPYQITGDEIFKRCKEWGALNYTISCLQSNSSTSIEECCINL